MSVASADEEIGQPISIVTLRIVGTVVAATALGPHGRRNNDRFGNIEKVAMLKRQGQIGGLGNSEPRVESFPVIVHILLGSQKTFSILFH